MDWNWLIPVGGICLAIYVFFMLKREAGRELHRIQNVGRICLVCGYDLRATPDRCPECGTVVPPELPLRLKFDMIKLANDWPPDAVTPRSPEPNEFPVLLLDTQNQFQAKLLGDQLQARGIDARVTKSRPVSTGDILSPGSVTYAKVLIWSQDIDRAMAIAHSFSSGPMADGADSAAEKLSAP